MSAVKKIIQEFDWDEISLFEMAQSRKDLFDDGDWIESEHITDDGIRLIQTGNIGIGRFVEKENKKFIFDHSFEKLKCKALRVGDLLICRLAEPAGRACVLPDIGFDRIVTSVDVTIFRPPADVANRQFLANLFSTEDWFRIVRDRSGGTTHKRIARGALGKIRVKLPDIKTQNAIAEALSDADALIESLESLIAKKRAIKQGAMQELLSGQRRLPGFQKNHGFHQTLLGSIPRDWDATNLGELFEITSSKRVFQNQWKTRGVPFYRAREIAVLAETGSVDNELFIDEELYRQFRNQYGVPEVGDLLVTGVGTLGKVHVVENNSEFYFKDGNIIWFKLRSSVDSNFLRHLYSTPAITKQISDSSGGTTVGTYTISGAKKTLIPLPSKVEQQAIAEVLTAMDVELNGLTTRLSKLRQIKQGMMQDLLTGKVRLV